MNSSRQSISASVKHFATPLVIVLLFAPAASYGQTVPNCEPSLAEAYLSANNVRARLFNNGNLYWRGDPYVYEIPQGSGNNALFVSGIWIGGMIGDQLSVAGSKYGPYEFWPGPVNEVMSGQDCAQYDRIYKITQADFTALNSGEQPSNDFLEWPWELGAPVIDGDGNLNNYNILGGDRPELLGDETLFWIMNDIGNEHTETDTPPLGIEVHVSAFSTTNDSNEHFPNTTFYRYKLINKNDQPIQDMYFGMYTDSDIGGAHDDYIGSDSLLSLAFAYNADNDDEENYGVAPPALGIQWTGGPINTTDGIDNDRDGQIDEPGEMMPMTSFAYYTSNPGPAKSSLDNGMDFYNFMRGRWRNGSPITEGGNGIGFSTTPSMFMYSGNPPAFWSEFNRDNAGEANSPADRRMVSSVGPFNLQPGEETELFISVVTAFGADNLDSVYKLKEAASSFMGLTARTVPKGLSFLPPSQAPRFTGIGSGATNQPINSTLRWTLPDPSLESQIQIALRGDFSSATEIWTWDTFFQTSLQPNAQYGARIRGKNSAGIGPWSPILHFSTGETTVRSPSIIKHFLVTQNASGPLTTPDMGTLAINGSGFPRSNGMDRPSDMQQVNGSTWALATGLSNRESSNWSTFVTRVFRDEFSDIIPYDFEIRFTPSCYDTWRTQHDTGTSVVPSPVTGGCYGYDRLDYLGGGGKNMMLLPFEVWRTGIHSPDNPLDDVRMIPVALDWAADGWGIQPVDHPVSGGSDDPQTDWTYWFLPNDTSPGQGGYDAWVADGFSGDPTNHGREVFSNVVFVNWNGGEVSEPENFNADMPEPGTIFRIETDTFSPPIPSFPAEGQVLELGRVSFFWQSNSYLFTRIQLASDAAFTNILWEQENPQDGVTTSQSLDVGMYYWRVFDAAHASSEITSFRIQDSIGGLATEDPLQPIEFALEPAYPNPFNPTTTVSFSLPHASDILISVYDALGREIRTLVHDASLEAGHHTTQFDGSQLVSGVYFIRMKAGLFTEVQQVVLLK